MLSVNLMDNKPWLKPRVKARTFYKRVVLLFMRPPSMFSLSPMKVLSFDGRFWVEAGFQHNAIQTRVVREGYPKRHTAKNDANENVHLPVELTNEGFHVVEFKVHNRMTLPLTGRVKSGILVCIVLYTLWWIATGLAWYWQVPLAIIALTWAKITLRGGIGNTGVAKQVAGVTSPFILTPYMLVKHVEGRRELVQQEGAEL